MSRVMLSTSIRMVRMEVMELPKKMPWPTQALLLSRIEWGHLPSPTSLISTLEFVFFPSFPPPLQSLIAYYLLF